MIPLAETITVTFDPVSVITWLIIGLIAGTLAGSLLGMRRMGLLGHIIVGFIGAFIGGFLLSASNFQIRQEWLQPLATLTVNIIVAFVGAALLLLVYRIFFRRFYY